MRPPSDRFRLVEALRVAASQADRCGGLVEVRDIDVSDGQVAVISVDPRRARIIADELERRWVS